LYSHANRIRAVELYIKLVQSGLAIGEPAAEQDVPIRQLLSDILAPYVLADADKVRFSGDKSVAISPTAVTGMALILHELATNAAKYGALSHPGGSLSVEWQRSTRLKIIWSESGGAGIAAPIHSGPGSNLTRRTVEGQFRGTIAHHWLDGGLQVIMDLPISAVCGPTWGW
jgi:two-component sensor histidine kinase